jgi:uncharacterized protein
MSLFRKINRLLHRDLGYFFAGMTFIYVISGIAMNHRDLWSPGYIITRDTVRIIEGTINFENISESVTYIARNFSDEKSYKSYYFPDKQTLKIFIKDGSLEFNSKTNVLIKEILRKRPFFGELDYLHRNPKSWWTWFSDFYALGLIIITLSGLIILKGKNGFIWRGLIYVIIGILIPILFLVFSNYY